MEPFSIQSPNSTHSDIDVLRLVHSQPASSGSSVLGAVFNLATTIVGAGIMALPRVVSVLGLFLGVLFILFMGFATEISIELLIRFFVLRKSTTYGEIVGSALGHPARIISEVFITISNAGYLVVYLIIIGDVMSGSDRHVGVFRQWFGHTALDHRALVVFLFMIIFLVPLCALEKIDSLVVTSGISVALAVVFVVISCITAFVKTIDGTIRWPRMGPNLSSRDAIIDLLVVLPIMINAYICHFNVPPIYNELRDRSAEKMNRVGRITITLCVVIYACTAVSGYLLFGDDTDADVLTNFDHNLGIKFSTGLNFIIRVGYVFHLVLTFPLIHFSLRQTVATLIFKGEVPVDRKRVWGLTAILLIIIYIASTVIPNIWVAFKFTGATTAVSLGFIFPALIALRLDKQETTLKKGERIVAWVMLVSAVVVGVVGVVGNVLGPERNPVRGVKA